jgi:hypothetical protein
MKPMAAVVAAALISGVAMYTVGAKTATVDAFSQTPALVQTTDGQYVPVNQLATARPATVTPRPVYRAPAPQRTVSRAAAPVAAERVVVRDEAPAQRSWKKTALIIGGSAASGAGVGGIVHGKKGALIGAAIGGGAASIFEATKR